MDSLQYEASGVSYRQRYGAVHSGQARKLDDFVDPLPAVDRLALAEEIRASTERRTGDECRCRLQVCLRGVFHINRVDQVFAVAYAPQLASSMAV